MLPGTLLHTAVGPAAWKRWLLTVVVCAFSAAGPMAGARADESQGEFVLAPATVPVTQEMEVGVLAALRLGSDLLPEVRHFAITDVRQSEGWALVSVIGLAQVGEDLAWGIDDGAWFGLILLRQEMDDGWTGAVQGTAEFSQLLAEVPEAFIRAQARQDLAPIQRVPLAGSGYVFPWEPGTSMMYGFLGVHSNGFSFGDHVGWKAVDMLSDGDTAAGHAPNRLLAAEAGTITYKCTDANNVAIRIGNFFYTHLEDNAGLLTGVAFTQGAELGQMKVGSFGTQGSGCGWAQQSEGWFHVHWGFPDADLQVEDWTLSMSTQNWANGTTTVTPGNGWILASGVSLPRISGNTGVGGARLSYDAGGLQSVNADASGAYSIQIPEDWSGSITPSLPGYRFDPPIRTYENVGSDQVAQDYAASPLARPRPSDGQTSCNPVAIGVDLLLTDDTRTANGNLDASTFLLRLDDVNVTAQTAVRVPSTAPVVRATIVYTPPALAAGEHTASFRYDDLGRTVNVNWSFTVEDAGCGELLTAPAVEGTSRSLTDAALPAIEDPSFTAYAETPGYSAPVDDVRAPQEPPTQTAQPADATPVLSGGPLGCLPWGLTCPRTIRATR